MRGKMIKIPGLLLIITLLFSTIPLNYQNECGISLSQAQAGQKARYKKKKEYYREKKDKYRELYHEYEKYIKYKEYKGRPEFFNKFQLYRKYRFYRKKYKKRRKKYYKYRDLYNSFRPTPTFTSHITDLSKISKIVPPGRIEGNLVKTHSYIFIANNQEVPVFAPIDATLSSGVYYLEDGVSQYSLFFDIDANDDIFFIMDHIQTPVREIASVFPSTPRSETYTEEPRRRLSFKAGDLIGYSTGTYLAHHWDFGVYNENETNFLKNETRYNISERDKIAICPFDYFKSSLKSSYTSLFNSVSGTDPYPTSFCD